jgi:hypothetical protein
MSTHQTETIEGTFECVVYSPRGELEGVLLDVGGKPVQVVFEPHDSERYGRLADIDSGQTVVVKASAQSLSDKGKPAHAVFDLVELVTIDGRPPGKPITADGAAYKGKVVRLNFARHGEPNGVVLDSGDFIHTKPHGFKRLKLKLGDMVEADGDAQQLVTGKGWAVEAYVVNGKLVD